MKSLRVALMFAAVFTIAPEFGFADCLGDIYKGVESGQKFHPLWPFISGTEVVGTVVLANNPKKPQAYFGSIDSPDYRPIGATVFSEKQIGFTTPTSCSSASNVGVDVAFSQLDALSKSLTQGAKSPSLTSTTSQVLAPKQSTGSNAQNGAATSGNGSGTSSGSNGSTDNNGGSPNSNSQAPTATDPNAAVEKDTYRDSTGIDFSHITGATLKITGLAVEYYDLPVLSQLNAGTALNPTGAGLLTNDQHGWIISRALIAQTVEYTLTSDSDVHASFLAQLTSWLPGMKFKYASARKITLTTTSPVTIGYKLWQRGVGFGGAAVGACSQHGCQLGADEIDHTVFGSQ